MRSSASVLDRFPGPNVQLTTMSATLNDKKSDKAVLRCSMIVIDQPAA